MNRVAMSYRYSGAGPYILLQCHNVSHSMHTYMYNYNNYKYICPYIHAHNTSISLRALQTLCGWLQQRAPLCPAGSKTVPSARQPHTMYTHVKSCMPLYFFFHTVWADIIHVHMYVHKEVKEHPPKEQNGANIREELWVQQEN